MPKLRPRVRREAAQPNRATIWISVGSKWISLAVGPFRKATMKMAETAMSISALLPTRVASRRMIKRIMVTLFIKTRRTVEREGGKGE
jgi:hypothetical protein